MTTPEAVLSGLLIASWSWRLGWHTGAVGMSRAMSGHPRGWQRVIVWWKERGQPEPTEAQAAEAQQSEFAERLKNALAAQHQERPGQYL